MTRIMTVILTISTCAGCIGMSVEKSNRAAETMLNALKPLYGGNIRVPEYKAIVEAYTLEMNERSIFRWCVRFAPFLKYRPPCGPSSAPHP